MEKTRSERRRMGRYITLVILVAALIGGWSWFWHYAADKAQAAVEGWRAREAKAGRVYSCGSQHVGGFPFRFEVNCDNASAQFRSNQPPVEVKAGSVLVAAQIYDPKLLISEINGPLTIADIGQAPKIIANWKLGQSSVRGTPKSPERVSLVFDEPVVDLVSGDKKVNLLHAKRIEVHGRIAAGSAANNPVIEIVFRLNHASAPAFNPATVAPVDADVTGVLRGLGDFSPKPWRERFRELQKKGGRIDITRARVPRRYAGRRQRQPVDRSQRPTRRPAQSYRRRARAVSHRHRRGAGRAEITEHGQGRRHARPPVAGLGRRCA
jgi:hypothetical protein